VVRVDENNIADQDQTVVHASKDPSSSVHHGKSTDLAAISEPPSSLDKNQSAIYERAVSVSRIEASSSMDQGKSGPIIPGSEIHATSSFGDGAPFVETADETGTAASVEVRPSDMNGRGNDSSRSDPLHRLMTPSESEYSNTPMSSMWSISSSLFPSPLTLEDFPFFFLLFF
jgi:hypothetical protein